jgi:hypothetical protein
MEKRYEDIKEYLRQLKAETRLAVISMQMAANALGITRPAIERMARTQRLDVIRLKKTRCVRALQILELIEGYEKQVDSTRRFLEKCAKKGRSPVFYTEVMERLGLATSTPADRKLMGRILGDVSEQTYREHKVLLSAIVHRKGSGSTSPGPGYQSLLEYLNENYKAKLSNDIAKHVKEVLHFYGGR